MKKVRVFLFVLFVCTLFAGIPASANSVLNNDVDFLACTNISMADSIGSDPVVAFPNAFIPNDNNALLKVFKPGSPQPQFFAEYKMVIYNRWGMLLFESSDPAQGWDGRYKDKPCPVETYVYVVTYRLIMFDGSTSKTATLKGNVTLLE